MAEFEVREFETMVDDTLQRIIDANIGITNIYPGSVIRTIVESLLAELDVQNYSIDQIYKAMNIDTATGEDLERVVSILGIIRKDATYAEGTVVFGRSDAYATDIAIQYAQIVSTKQNTNTANNNATEFMVIDDNAKLSAGDLEVAVTVRALEPGVVYLPENTITIMNTPIVGIEYVTNTIEISGGSNKETDDELRIRAKHALAGLGKGTIAAIRSVILGIDGVVDVVMLDVNRGVGTTDAIIITENIPPSEALQNEITEAIRMTKAAGIDVGTIYPTISTQDIVVKLTDTSGGSISEDIVNSAGNAIIDYCNSLTVGSILIISQLERAIGNAINDNDIDIVVQTPSANVVPTSTQVIRNGSITINGVLWNG